MNRRLAIWLLCMNFVWIMPGLAQAATEKPVSITATELARRLQQDPHMIIADVRSPKSFNRRHIKGAQSYPMAQIKQWAPRLKPGEWIVFYCACPHDETSTKAAEQLMSEYAHDRTLVLKLGIDGWIAKGYPFVEAPPRTATGSVLPDLGATSLRKDENQAKKLRQGPDKRAGI